MNVTLFSFGFKHDRPDADTVVDVRFLPNPYYVPELSAGTGLDKDVAGYVLDNPEAERFFSLFIPFLVYFIERHCRADRQPVRLAIGCTGGKHRSVAVVEKIRDFLEEKGIKVDMSHRDIRKI